MNEKNGHSAAPEPKPLAPGECWIWVRAKVHAKDEHPDVYVGRVCPHGIDPAAVPSSIPNSIKFSISPFVRVEDNKPLDSKAWHAIEEARLKYDIVVDGCVIDKKETRPGKLVIKSSLGDEVTLSLDEDDGKIIDPAIGLPSRLNTS